MLTATQERRSGKRVEAALSVQIRGTDARGIPFEEQAPTVNVSEQGLCLLTRRELEHAANLNVMIAGRGAIRAGGARSDFQAHALVVYVFKEGEVNRVGIRFVGATLPMDGV